MIKAEGKTKKYLAMAVLDTEFSSDSEISGAIRSGNKVIKRYKYSNKEGPFSVYNTTNLQNKLRLQYMTTFISYYQSSVILY